VLIHFFEILYLDVEGSSRCRRKVSGSSAEDTKYQWSSKRPWNTLLDIRVIHVGCLKLEVAQGADHRYIMANAEILLNQLGVERLHLQIDQAYENSSYGSEIGTAAWNIPGKSRRDGQEFSILLIRDCHTVIPKLSDLWLYTRRARNEVSVFYSISWINKWTRKHTISWWCIVVSSLTN